jgi:hypothetical protein
MHCAKASRSGSPANGCEPSVAEFAGVDSAGVESPAVAVEVDADAVD